MTRSHRLLWLTGLVLLFIASFLLAAFPTRNSNDDWWHIKTGWYQVTRGDPFPDFEVFTYTGEETPWPNHEWLSDLLIYLGYDLLGLRGVTLAKAAIVGLTFALLALLILRRTGNYPLALLLALIAAVSSQYSLHLRPAIFTYLALTVLLHLLLSLERSVSSGHPPYRQILLLYMLAVPWINLHGGGVLAIIVTTLSALGFGVEWWWQSRIAREPESASRNHRLFTWSLVAAAAVFLGTFCNPYGYQVHLLPFRVMRDPSLVEAIFELQTPNFHYAKGYEAIILGLVLLAALARVRVRFPDLLLLLFFLQQSLNFVRHLPIFSIVAAPVLAELAVAFLAGWFSPNWRLRGQRLVLIAFAFGCAIRIPEGYLRNWSHLWQVPEGYDRRAYPSDAVDFILARRFHGRMYNEINYSGYLIFRLSPDHFKVFTDARFDIYGSQFMHQSHAIMDAAEVPRPDPRASGDWLLALEQYHDHVRDQLLRGRKPRALWRWLLDRWEVNFLLLYRGSRLFAALHHNPDPEWREVYLDDGYAIYLRDVPENADLIRRCLTSG